MFATDFALWGLFLAIQNISFTYVSRARNSGSLLRHVKAAIFSNGIWFVQQTILLGPLFDMVTGKAGHVNQILAGLFYTVMTVSGGVLAHYLALATEKGKNAVGANKKYAQVPVEEWAKVQELLKNIDTDEWKRIKGLAEQAYTMSVDTIPSSGIAATKIAGETIVTGIPSRS